MTVDTTSNDSFQPIIKGLMIMLSLQMKNAASLQ
jgi:hypothetical protein